MKSIILLYINPLTWLRYNSQNTHFYILDNALYFRQSLKILWSPLPTDFVLNNLNKF